MAKLIKSQNGSVTVLLIILLVTCLSIGMVAFRQRLAIRSKPGQTSQVNNNSSSNNQTFATKQVDFKINEWEVGFKIPAEYVGNLYYQLGVLNYEQQPTASMPGAGQYVSFSFKSLITNYPECAASSQRVALLHRAAIGQAHLTSNPQASVGLVKRIGKFEYSFVLPRRACIEGSFPYHEAEHKLYDQFRTQFPQLIAQLEAS